jgi:hypothetical protein
MRRPRSLTYDIESASPTTSSHESPPHGGLPKSSCTRAPCVLACRPRSLAVSWRTFREGPLEQFCLLLSGGKRDLFGPGPRVILVRYGDRGARQRSQAEADAAHATRGRSCPREGRDTDRHPVGDAARDRWHGSRSQIRSPQRSRVEARSVIAMARPRACSHRCTGDPDVQRGLPVEPCCCDASGARPAPGHRPLGWLSGMAHGRPAGAVSPATTRLVGYNVAAKT